MSAEPEPGQRGPRSCACPPCCNNTGHRGFACPPLCKKATGALSRGRQCPARWVLPSRAGAELTVMGTLQGKGSCSRVLVMPTSGSLLTCPQAASGKQGAGEPLTQRALGREPLYLSAAALQLEITSWLAHVGAGRGEAHGAPRNSHPRACLWEHMGGCERGWVGAGEGTCACKQLSVHVCACTGNTSTCVHDHMCV